MQYLNFMPYLIIGAIITFTVRLFPFVVFKDKKKIPDVVLYIGKYLPFAVISAIVVYCLRGVKFVAPFYGYKEILAATIVIFLHLWKENTLLSILTGTLLYMFLVQN